MRKARTAALNVIPLVLAAAAVWAAPAPGDTVSPEIGSFTLYAEHNVTLGAQAVIRGPIGAGNDVSAGICVDVESIFVDDDIWLGKNATVRGTVLANDKAEAGADFDFAGPGWAGKSVCLGSNASVTGRVAADTGSVCISSNARVAGDVTGNYNIYIAKDSVIMGDVSPGLRKDLSVGSHVEITGTVTSAVSPFDTFDAPTMGAKPDKGHYGKLDISQGHDGVITLAPGAYGDVNMWGARTTTNLSAGVYTMKEFWVAGEGTVNVDTTDGDVTLNIHKDFDTGAGVTFNTIGAGALEINLFDSNVSVGGNTSMEADIRVWDGTFDAGENLRLIGTVWAHKDISLGWGSDVRAAAVPEPSCLAMLACGAAWVLRRRRPAA